MKKSILSLAIASTISMAANAGVDNILITEMTQSVDGSLGAVEITNMGSETFTFSDETAVYSESGKYKNKLQKGDGTALLTGLSLAAGKSLVIVNKDASDDFKKTIVDNGGMVVVGEGKAKYTNFYINGNDRIFLQHNGVIVDRIGNTNYDTWAPHTTLRRKLTADGTTPKQSDSYDEKLWHKTTNYLTLDTGNLGRPDLTDAATPNVEKEFDCPAEKDILAISAVQGSKHISPYVGKEIALSGVVTAKVSLPNEGFYLTDLAAKNDGDPMTSDGIFVPTTRAKNLKVGNTICIGGIVSESEGQTQLPSPTELSWHVTDNSEGSPTYTSIEVMPEDNGSFDNTLERYEGMLVKFSDDLDPQTDGKQDLRVTRNYSFNHHKGDHKRNNITLSYKRINIQPNQEHVAGSPESKAQAEENLDYRLILEDRYKPKGQTLNYYPGFNTDPKANYIRLDDSIINIEGVISQYYTENNTAVFNEDGTNPKVFDYSLTVLNDLDGSNFKHNLARDTYWDEYDEEYKPKISSEVDKGHFAIRVAGQNLLNFFNSPFGGDANLYGQSRGAETEAEYLRQRTKLVKAIQSLDADVLALMEMENNGFGTDSAVAEMVNQVNVKYVDERAQGSIVSDNSTENRYVFVGFDHNGNQMLDNLDAIGKDSIATGIMYRPSKMSIERTRVIDMPRQKAPAITNANGLDMYNKAGEILENGENYHRNALVVTFVVNQTGKRLTVAVNHLKSKGSTCWEDWQGVDFGDETVWDRFSAPNVDQQGSCSEFRVAGAVHLGEEMEDIPGDKIILGDLNAYAQEDPLLVLTENPRNKTLVTSSHTFIGNKPQFNQDGSAANVTKTYGYVNIIDKVLKKRDETPWSYSYSDVVGSLDHILISPSLEKRVIDATDWHINAPESDMYSYSNKYKTLIEGTDVHRFYQPDVFRSSDHDPALMTLSYKHGESDSGQALRLTKLKKLVKVPYQIPVAAGAKKGDVAIVNLSPVNDELNLDLDRMTLPSVVLNQDGQSLVNFQVYGAPSARYNVTVSLTRNGEVIDGSTQSFEAHITNRDSLVADIVKEESDGSGGSTGFISLLSLLSLSAMRRRFRK